MEDLRELQESIDYAKVTAIICALMGHDVDWDGYCSVMSDFLREVAA